ncbi:MAG TPA: hypothetical protein VH394_02875, partial [Thermoanaerobaculia bacterium]|nr:hypothetical protein [Thermoanaerobaculia bacterium]
STFLLSTKEGKEAYIEPVLLAGTIGYRFTVKVGKAKDAQVPKTGTKLARGANFRCLLSGTPITGDYIKAEGKAGRIGMRLMAIVAEGERGRVYLPPTDEMEAIACEASSGWKPDVEFFQQALGFRIGNYGLTKWSDLFTTRQLTALTTFSDLVQEASQLAKRDAGSNDYANVIEVFLAFALSKATDRNSSLCVWETAMDRLRGTFGRMALPMVWDFAETNPFAGAGGDIYGAAYSLCEVLDNLHIDVPGNASQQDACIQTLSEGKIVSTDPPYYDNVPYADLSDFFYVWLRRSLRSVFPDLFSTLVVPKSEELVATPSRHGDKEKAEAFFLDGMTRAMHRLAEQVHPAFPVTIYYAFKQAESDDAEGTASTGWETFLDAVIRAGFVITGTWPIRTELGNRMRGMGSNALASSIVLVCRKQVAGAPSATRRELVTALKTELPAALTHLQRGNIAPVDLAQAAIGPGMAVYTRYSKVLDAEGNPLAVRDALALINQILDESLAEQEGDFDADSRWAVAWFEQFGFNEGEFGVAEILSKAKVTSVQGLKDAGILDKKTPGGKVRLLRPKELSASWDPATDPRLTAWEMVHHLIRVLEDDGEIGASALVARLGAKAEIARELCYRLYTICERKKRAAEALSYNALVQSWPEIIRLAFETASPKAAQPGLFGESG